MNDRDNFHTRNGSIYHSPVAACDVTHFGQSYGFHLAENSIHWIHYNVQPTDDRFVTIDLRDIFYGTMKFADIESEQVDAEDDGAGRRQYFIPIHRGCKPSTKLIFPVENREFSAAAIFTIYDGFDDDDHVNVFRYGADVYMRFTIDVKMALCGFKLLLHTIDGRLVKLQMNDVISPDYVKVIPNEGLPTNAEHGPSTMRGNLHLCFKIEYPKKLSRQSKREIAQALDRAQSINELNN